MGKIFSTLFVACLLLAACNSRTQQADEIQHLETSLRQQKETKLDTAAAHTFIEKSLTFVATYPTDTLAPVFLFNAADVSRNMGKTEESVRLWGRVNAEYPNYERAPDALFLQGFTCENNLSDTERALSYYQTFLDKYPKHPLVKDVSLSMEYLRAGKGVEEVVKSFPKLPTQ